MATIEFYREREAQSAADASAATSDHGRFLARRSEAAWRRLAELGEKREGRLVPVPAVVPALPTVKKSKTRARPKSAAGAAA